MSTKTQKARYNPDTGRYEAVTEKETPIIQTKQRKRSRYRSSLPQGAVKDAVIEAVKAIGPNTDFTLNHAWQKLSHETRTRLVDGYGGSLQKAHKAFIHNFSTGTQKGYVLGLRRIETHRDGQSIYRWDYTRVTGAEHRKAVDPRNEDTERLVFVMVGTTEDGETIYRNPEGHLGWVRWERL